MPTPAAQLANPAHRIKDESWRQIAALTMVIRLKNAVKDAMAG